MICNLSICLRRLCTITLRNEIKVILHIYFIVVQLLTWMYSVTFYMPVSETFILTASHVDINHNFVGSGVST